MANEFTNFLNKYGLGFRSFEQGMRQGDKRLAEQFKIPYDPLASVEERTIDPEAFRKLRESRMPQLPTPPQAGSAARPPRREITPPAPAERERPLDVLSFRESPNFPARLPSMDVPVPTRPDFSPQRSNMPPPGPGLLQPPTGMPQMPQPPKPDMDSTIDNLMARYEGMYGEPPVAPPPQQPVPQELGLPAFTTPGYFPEGMLSPQRPDMQPPAIQNYQPNMFSGQLPMPDMPEFDFGKYRYDYTPDLTEMTDEELNAYYSNILGY